MITPSSAADPSAARPVAAAAPAETATAVGRRPPAAAFRALVALAAATGVVIELSISTSVLRTLSYFTIQSNILLAVVLTLSAWHAWTARPPLNPLLTGGALLFIAITGLVYHLLLANSSSGFSMVGDPDFVMTAPHQAANQLLHTVTPIGATLNWLLLTRPGTYRRHHAALWLTYPLAYFAFALTRGALMPPGAPARYPYPFLDVEAHGYADVLRNAVVLGLAFYALALLLVTLDRIRPEARPPKTGFRLRPPVR
ncbi:Pr6Pr family membrane protein [Streptomyces beihaiensis]|uniref:Pr6Pr family membrane protein n=1 Tax=Streptomyces beihaiensis TaxID=2984495 RepID=A0ABT3TUP5_9ACTN|nr:Pr6Pr family membrane protein [Streptomyces beihaiensis]MCX3059800.1 Pr6Pr family membrane protein [Streptomyces beihaiensis]